MTTKILDQTMYRVLWINPQRTTIIPVASFRNKYELSSYLEDCLCPETGWSIEVYDLDGTVLKQQVMKSASLVKSQDVIGKSIQLFNKGT